MISSGLADAHTGTLLAVGLFDSLRDFEIVRALSAPYVETVGMPVAVMIFFGVTGIAMYVTQGRAVIPVVLFVMIGGVSLQSAPPQVGRLAVVMLMLFVTGIGWLLFARARRGGV